MARQKEEVISMVDTFQEFKELKNIDRSTMISVLEDSFRSVLAKMFETDENYDIIINLTREISRSGRTAPLLLTMSSRMRIWRYR